MLLNAWFSPVNLSFYHGGGVGGGCLNQEPRKEEGKFFFSPHTAKGQLAVNTIAKQTTEQEGDTGQWCWPVEDQQEPPTQQVQWPLPSSTLCCV